MRKHAFLHRLLALLTALLLLCAAGSSALAEKVIALNAADYPVTEDGWYLSMEEVAVYLATFDHLPDSFIKKNDAMRLGWDSRSGNLLVRAGMIKKTSPARPSAAIDLATMRARCPIRTAAAGRSATSTMTAATAIASASCFQTTG